MCQLVAVILHLKFTIDQHHNEDAAIILLTHYIVEIEGGSVEPL